LVNTDKIFLKHVCKNYANDIFLLRENANQPGKLLAGKTLIMNSFQKFQ